MQKVTLIALVAVASISVELCSDREPTPSPKPPMFDPCPVVADVGDLDLPVSRTAVEQGRLVIAALGSSSTFGRGATKPDNAYPVQLQKALSAALPGVDVHVLNFGVNGEDAPEELARMAAVVAAGPDLVIWQAGTNAALRGESPDVFRQQIARGVTRLRAAGADVVLMDNQRCPMLAAIAGHGAAEDAVLAQTAQEQNVGLFPRGALMDEWVQTGKPLSSFLFNDGLHQNDLGYLCLARALSASLTHGIQNY